MTLARLARSGFAVRQPERCFTVCPQLTSLFCAHASPRRTFVQNYSSVATALQDLVTTGRLKPDASQSFAARILDALQSSIKQCHLGEHHAELGTPLDPKEGNLNQQQPTGLIYPRGAYLWGTIGSGKTMLLDLFCSSFSDADQQQFGLSRLHFHEFMLKIHGQLHSLQESLPRIKGRSQFGLPVYRYAQLKGHPVDIVAQDIARGTKILCLDELHVSDVADALILGQLFSRMLQQGTFVLFTSNKTPAELYNNDLNRQYFLPFIKMLQKQLAVVEVSGATDYRLQDQVLESILAAPSTTSSGHAKRGTVKQVQQGLMLLGQNSSAQLEAAWCTTVGSLQSQARLDVGFGRRLHVPRQLSGHQVLEAEGADSHHTLPAAFFTFDQVCGQQGLGQGVDQGGALGPADMVALAAAYPLVFIQNLPVLQWSQRNEARRLVTLIDTLYDMRCSLECSAAGKPKQVLDHQPLKACCCALPLLLPGHLLQSHMGSLSL
ncbi:TPA: hypothetical protein ACH3X2_002900 [Trebouxia sp. C0005]